MADSQKYGRTAQLLDKDNIVDGGNYYPTSTEMAKSNNTKILLIPCKPLTTYTASRTNVITKRFTMCFLTSADIYEGMPIYGYAGSSISLTATSTSAADSQYLCFYYAKSGGSDSSTPEEIQNQLAEVMINEGPIAKPYQPYLKWQHSLRKLTTATEAVENPLYSDGTAITAYTIKGNTVQNGTPTPSNPVSVNGVGERTENLFDSSSAVRYEFVITNVYVGTITDGRLTAYAGGYCYVIKASPNVTYTLKVHTSDDVATLRAGFYSLPIPSQEDNIVHDGTQARNYTSNPTITITNSGNYPYLIVQMSGAYVSYLTITVGSTPPASFIPYGYKIPISSGGVTTNIYLSEPLRRIGDYADTIAADGTVTRVIKTYKITGQENWGVHGSIASWFFADNIVYPIIPTDNTLTSPTITSHFKVRAYANATSISNGECTFGHPSGILTQFRTILKNTDYTTVEDFTDWLKAQYNNGNPVTIWYASDTSTTETTTAPSIPTTEGANSITVDTTVHPSEFTATWTGWHDSSVKEWDGSQWG